MYYYLGSTQKTQDTLSRIFKNLIAMGPEDSPGVTSSWFVWASMGLYPYLPGVGGVILSKPLFSKILVKLPTSKILELKTVGPGQPGNYIQSVKVNEGPWDSTWIPFYELQNGGEIRLYMGKQRSTWGTSPDSCPPSYGDLEPWKKIVSDE
jgi:putative alpha-1,2-mannosidase